MSGNSILALSQQTQQQAPVRRLLLLRGHTDRESRLPVAPLRHNGDDKHGALTSSTGLRHSSTKLLPFLDSDEEFSTVENKVRSMTACGSEPQKGDAVDSLLFAADPRHSVSTSGPSLEGNGTRGTDEVINIDDNPTKLRPLSPARLKLHPPYAVRHDDNKKDTNGLSAIGWWGRFIEVDVNGCFRPSFELTLRPLDKHPAGVFYRAMVSAFEGWWQEHWETLVLSEGPSFGSSQVAKSSRGRGRQRKLPSRQPKSQKEDSRVQQLQAARVGLVWWYESVRVARLMAEHLLRAGRGAAEPGAEVTLVGDARGGDVLCETLQRPWVFEEGCHGAFVAITQTPIDNDPMNFSKWVRKDAENGLVKLYKFTERHIGGVLEQEIGKMNDIPVATVPGPERMLRLLHVLDEAWVHSASEAFRLPVLECEAPGYYRKINDAVSLYSLYADILRGATLDSMRRSEEYHKEHSSNNDTLRTSGDEFINYTSLRERFNVLQNNCTIYNGIGSELTRCAERLVSAARKVIRDMQAEEEGTVLHDSFPWARRRQEHQYQPHATKGSSWTAEQLEAAFPPSKMAQECLPISKCVETGIDTEPTSHGSRYKNIRKPSCGPSHGTEQLSTIEKTDRGHRVLRLTSHLQDNAQIQKDEKNSPDHNKKAKTRKLQPPKVSATASKKEKTIFWVCCDRCKTWRELPNRIDPPPSYWECAYMGLECPETSEKRVVPPETSVKHPRRGRPPRPKVSPKAEKRPRVSKQPNHNRKHPKSSNSSSSNMNSASSDTDNDSDDEFTSSTSTSSVDSDKLQEIKSELERLEMEPVNEDPHGLLERLRLLEKQLDF